MEPRAARPDRRIEAIAALATAGVPVGVMVAPVIPGLNDSEVPRILAAAARAGARSAGWVLLRLAKPIDDLFEGWLAERLPEQRARVLGRIRESRGGRLTDTRFGRRMRGDGPYADHLAALFAVAARKAGLDAKLPPLVTTAFRRPSAPDGQLGLFSAEGSGSTAQLGLPEGGDPPRAHRSVEHELSPEAEDAIGCGNVCGNARVNSDG